MSSLCCLVVAEDAQVRGEISGVGVIVAEDAAATRKSVLGQHPRSVQIAQRDQVNGEAVGRAGVSWWSSPRMRRRRTSVSWFRPRAACGSPRW